MGEKKMTLNKSNYGSSINSFVAGMYDLPSAHASMLLSEPVQSWHKNVMSQLDELTHLQIGWDGYQGIPVTFENATFALRVIEAICEHDTQPPQIIPGVSGDLQIEWHTLRGDIELHVKAPNDVRAWHSTFDDGSDEEELSLTFNFTKVAGWLKQITETPIVIIAAEV